MIKTTRILTLASVLGVSALALAGPGAGGGPDATGFAGKPGGHHRGGPKLSKMIGKHAAELGLAPEKLKAIEAAEERARPELVALHEKAHAERKALREGTGSEARVEAAMKAVRDRREALRNEVEAQLTDAQKQKLRALMEAKRKEMMEKRGAWGAKGRAATAV